MITPRPVTDNNIYIVCLACFHRQHALLRPCQKRGSRFFIKS
jgi:hypothetical protein